MEVEGEVEDDSREEVFVRADFRGVEEVVATGEGRVVG